MDKETLDELVKLDEKFQEACDAACDRYQKVWGLTHSPKIHIDGWRLDGTEFSGEGDEYWSYGGHEHHGFSLDLDSLWDESWWEAQEKKAAEMLSVEAERQQRILQGQKAKRLADYEKLKKEFNG